MWLVTCSGWYDNTRYYLNELFLLKQKNPHLITILFPEKLKSSEVYQYTCRLVSKIYSIMSKIFRSL